MPLFFIQKLDEKKEELFDTIPQKKKHLDDDDQEIHLVRNANVFEEIFFAQKPFKIHHQQTPQTPHLLLLLIEKNAVLRCC